MPRPAIVIGIGGTGSWVLSWLKKDLMETYGSLEDQPIRLLLIDTADVIATVGAAGADQAPNHQRQQVEPSNRAGSYSRYIVLDQTREFVQIPTDKEDSHTRRLKSAVLAGDAGMDHISRWWQADFYPDAMLKLSDGAGQFRQLGRLALMQGLHLNGANDQVYATLSNMIDQVTRISMQKGYGGSLDVHIAGSLLGGTGSGIFIDIAWLVRKVLEARGDQVQPFITGFFALPRAFSAQPRLDGRMKAFAAWRELNRMMTVRERETEFLVKWGQADSTTFTARKEVYDHIYLVDKGIGMPGARPEESVFPVMAEAISFYLDSNAGMRYIQHIRTNLVNPKQSAPLRGNPTYSVLNVRSWKLPTYHNIRVARHEFAREFLRRLLQVEEQQAQNYNNPGAARTTYAIKSDPLYRQRSSEILIASMQDTGGTQFLEDIATIRQISNDQFETTAQQRAYYAFNLLSMYVQMPQTPDGIAVQNVLNESAGFAVSAMVDSNSNGELEAHLRNTESLLYGVNHLGGEYLRLYGDFAGEVLKGKLYDDLAHAHNFHLEVFRKRVRAWLDMALNEPSNERFGGLACVRDVITQLVEDLRLAIRFYTSVKGALATINQMQGNADTQYTNAFNGVMKRGLLQGVLNMVGVGAKRDVELYFEHENVNQATKRDHRAVERVLNTLREMQNYLESNIVPRIEAMVQQLVTDNDFTRVSGLYRGLMDSLQDENENYAFDRRLGEITQLLEASTQIAVDTDKIDELLKRTKWTIDDRMNLRVEIRLSLDPNDPPITLESNMRDAGKTTELVNRLVEGVASYVVFSDDDQTALTTMGVDQLTSALPNMVGRYLHEANLQKPAARDMRTFYVRATAKQAESQEIQRALGSLNIPRGSTNAVEFVDSDNSNKVTIFSARELIMPESFAEWVNTKEAYRTMVIGDKRQNIPADFDRVFNDHLFAAEREALRIEYQYYQNAITDAELPILDQRLVHLLEEHGRFNQFLNMWAQGWVTAEKDNPTDSEFLWRIHLPEEYNITITLARRGEVDMLGLIAKFVIYGKTMQGRDINYTQIDRVMENIRRQTMAAHADAETLLEAYRFEAKTAEKMAEAVRYQLEMSGDQIEPTSMKTHLDRTAEAFTDRPERYVTANNRRSLAEEIAYDFARYDQNANPLVSNTNAHLQAMAMLLRQKYGDLARVLEQELRPR